MLTIKTNVHYEPSNVLKEKSGCYRLPSMLRLEVEYEVLKGIKGVLFPKIIIKDIKISNLYDEFAARLLGYLNLNEIECLLWEDYASRILSEDDIWDNFEA